MDQQDISEIRKIEANVLKFIMLEINERCYSWTSRMQISRRINTTRLNQLVCMYFM